MNKVILLILPVVFAGCSALLPVEPPDVTLVNLKFSDLTVFETTGVFTVRISNSNPQPLTIDGGVYRLYLNGLNVGKALSSARIEVPRLGSATDDVTLHINNLAAATRLGQILEGGDLDYRIKAKLFVEGTFGTRRISSVYEGRFSFGDSRTDAPPPPPRESPVDDAM